MKKRAKHLVVALCAFALLVGAPAGLSSVKGTHAMTEAEAANFYAFVSFWAEQDICWKRTVTRGVGLVPTECPNGEKDAGLCYPKCRDGFKGVGPVCWQSCPAGYRDDGAFCAKPGPYGRGSGYAVWNETKCRNENGDCEKWGAMWYPKCKPGFHPVGCCICSPDCPSGMTDIGASCAKQTYGRGVGKVPSCRTDQDYDAGLCYGKCPAGTSGVGPVCWGSCPSDMPVNCGAGCAKSSADCANAIINQVQSAGELVLNVASLVSGAGPAAKVGLTAAKNAGRAAGKHILTKEARQAGINAAKRKLREQAQREGKSMSEEALDHAAEALEIAKENGEFDWTMLDPTGVGSVIQAFYKPICGETLPDIFPKVSVPAPSAASVGQLAIPAAGSLIRNPRTGAAYIVDRGQRRWIPDPQTFNAMGLRWENIRDLPEVAINAIPEGPAMPKR